MKKLMIAAAALLLSAPLFAQEKNFIDQPYLEVNGRAEMEVAPDEIYVRITINVTSRMCWNGSRLIAWASA